MFKLIKQAYYKIYSSFDNVKYDDEKLMKMLDKEPSLFKICRAGFFHETKNVNRLLENPRLDKKAFAVYLVAHLDSHDGTWIDDVIKRSNISKDKEMMEYLITKAGHFFSYVGGDLANDYFYNLAINAENNKFSFATSFPEGLHLSESSIRWWYEKDHISIFKMLQHYNKVPIELIKKELSNQTISFNILRHIHLQCSKEEMVELCKIDGRMFMFVDPKNISMEAYQAAISNSDPGKQFNDNCFEYMEPYIFNDNETFLNFCRENGNFFMFFDKKFDLEKAYGIAKNNSNSAFDIKIMEYCNQHGFKVKSVIKRLISLDGNFLKFNRRNIDLNLYRLAKANGFKLGNMTQKFVYPEVEDNVEDFITLIMEEPELIKHISISHFSDSEFFNKFFKIVSKNNIDFPLTVDLLVETAEGSKSSLRQLLGYYKEKMERNNISSDQLNALFNYSASIDDKKFAKYMQDTVCDFYNIDPNFFSYHVMYGSRVNRDFLVTLNPQMLQDKYHILYEDKGHDAYNKLYVLGTFPDIQQKIINIGRELEGESLGNSSRRVELLKRMLDSSIISNNSQQVEEWVPNFSNVVEYVSRAVPMFSYFADHLEELDDKKIDLLTSHALGYHKFPINSMEDLENYDVVRKQYIDKLYAKNSLESVREAFLEEYFGISPLIYSKLLMFKTGVLEAKDKYDSEIVTLFEKLDLIQKVENPKKFIEARENMKSLDLSQFNAQNNFRYLHLMMGLKQSILKTYNDTLYQIKEDDNFVSYGGCKFYKAAGEEGNKSFNLSITSLGAYSSFDPFEENFSFNNHWNMPLVASHGICSSYLGNNNLGTASVECVILGFNNYEDGSLLTGAPYDLGSAISNKTFDAFSNLNRSMFLHPKELLDFTRHTHNEYVFERRYKNGKRQPNYVVLDVDNLDDAVALYEKYSNRGRYKNTKKLHKDYEERKRTPEEKIAEFVYFAMKCSKDFGIPIVVVEREKVAQNEWKKITLNLKFLVEKNDFTQEEVRTILHDVLVEFENNVVGNTYHPNVKDKCFNKDNANLVVGTIKSKITSLMSENPVLANVFLDELERLYSREGEKIGLFRKNKSRSDIDYQSLQYFVIEQRQIMSKEVIAARHISDLLVGQIGDNDCLMEYSTHYVNIDEQMSITDIRQILSSNDDLSNKLNLSINMIDTYGLYTNQDQSAHSRRHVEDVVLFSAVVGDSIGINGRDMDLLLACATFHDAGRSNDGNIPHASSSAALSKDRLINVFSQEEVAMIQAVIEFHEVRESKDENGNIDYKPLYDLCEKYGLDKENTSQMERCVRLSSVLKDADALDRTRFVSSSKAFVNIDYLRNDVSKKLFKVGIQLNEYYAKKDVEKALKEKPELIDDFQRAMEQFHSPKEVIRMYRKGNMNVIEAAYESEDVKIGTRK